MIINCITGNSIQWQFAARCSAHSPLYCICGGPGRSADNMGIDVGHYRSMCVEGWRGALHLASTAALYISMLSPGLMSQQVLRLRKHTLCLGVGDQRRLTHYPLMCCSCRELRYYGFMASPNVIHNQLGIVHV